MDGGPGMLLLPKGHERRLDPVAQHAEPVDAGMAGGTQGDQPAAVMDSGMAVVHGERSFRPAAAVAAAVTL